MHGETLMAEEDAPQDAGESEKSVSSDDVIHGLAGGQAGGMRFTIQPWMLAVTAVVLAAAILFLTLDAFVAVPSADAPLDEGLPTDEETPLPQEEENDPEAATETDADIEQAIHERVNEIRERNDLDLLDYDDELAAIAAAHSADMVARGYFSPVSPDGNDFRTRYDAAAYNCTIRSEFFVYDGAENRAQISIASQLASDLSENEKLFQIAKKVVDYWQAAPGYEDELLAPHWKHHGIGVERTADDVLYVTQNFC